MQRSILAAILLISTFAVGDDFYAVSNNSFQSSRVQTIDTSGNVSGTVTVGIGSTAFNNAGLAFGSAGTLYGLSNDGFPNNDFFLSTINPANGATGALVGLGNTLGFEGLAFNPGTQLLYSIATGTGDSFLYSIAGGGQLHSILDLGANFGPGFPAGGGLAFDTSNGLFYAISKDSNGIATLYSLNVNTMTVTIVGILSGGGNNTFAYDGGLTFDANNGLLYAFTASSTGGPSTLQAFNINGQLAGSSVALNLPAGDSYNGGLAAIPSSVPEPGTLLLLTSGLAGLALKRRRTS